MSFGLSSGGGQVRYAIIVTDQATQPLNTIKNSFNQLATTSTTTAGKMAIMNNTFSASVSPIKNTGDAMNQLVTTHKSLGQQLGGIASGFKNNALAIGAAASSVLGLYQNYANLSSAQNAANKSATAAKAAQNSVTTATKALNKAIGQYGSNSKEAKAAQDKLTVAQERAVNRTESAKIAQDNLNQTMADFGINILPNVILAGGSIVSIFDNIGKSGSGVTGIFSKLGGVLGGLIPSFGGIGSKAAEATKGFDGISTSSKAATGGVSGLQAALVGGLVITGAAIIIQQVQAIQDAFDQAGIKFAKMKAGMLFSPTELLLSFDQLDELMHATGMSAGQLGEDMEGAKKKFVDAGGALDKSGNIIWGSFNKAQEASKNLKAEIDKMSPSLNTAATSCNAMVNTIIVLRTQAEKGQITWNQYFDALAKLKIPGDEFTATMDEVNVRMKSNSTVVSTASKNAQVFSKDTLVLTSDIIDFEKAVAQSEAAVAENDSTIAGFGDTIENLRKKFLALSAAQKDLFGTKMTPDVLKFYDLLSKGNVTAKTGKSGLAEIKATIAAVEEEEGAIVKLGEGYGMASDQFTKFLKNGKDDTAMMNEMVAMSINYTKALDDQILNQQLISKGFLDGMIQAEGFFENMVKGTEQEGVFNAALADGAKSLGIHSNLLAFSSTKMQQLIKDTYEQSRAYDAEALASAKSTAFLKDQALIMPQVNKGILDGTVAANDWSISNIKATAEGFAFHDQLLKITEDMTGLIIPTSTTDEALKKMQTTMEETDDAAMAMAEMITDNLTPSFERMSSLIQSKDMKELRDNLKKMELPKGFGKGLDDAFKPLQGAAESARKVGNAMDILVTSGENMSKKDLAKNMKAFGDELDRMSKIKGTSAPVDAILMSLKNMPLAELDSHTKSMQFLSETIDKYGKLPTDKAKEFLDMFNKEIPSMGSAADTAATGVNTLADALLRVAEANFDPSKFILKEVTPKGMHVFKDPSLAASTGTLKKMPVIDQRDYQKGLQLAINNAAQTFQIINQTIAKISGIKMPTPSESTYQKGLQLAINNAGQTVQIIKKTLDKISSIKVPSPNEKTYQKGLQLAIDNAAQTVKLIKKSLDGIGSIKVPAPKFNNFNSALDQAVSDAKRAVRDINNALKNINKAPTGQQGAYGGAKTDSSTASKFDLEGSIMSVTNTNSGGSGDIIIENHNHIMDQDIVRRFKAQQGNNRYRFGLG